MSIQKLLTQSIMEVLGLCTCNLPNTTIVDDIDIQHKIGTELHIK
jgi:hypothetical protein